MFRLLNNPRGLFLLSALTAALLWLAPARSVRAAVYTYNARQRTINAGVLFVGSAADVAVYTPGGPNSVPDPAPYVFHVLDQRADVKPVGWSFVNPIAPSTISTAINTRWGGQYTAGSGVTSDMAAYWEVALRDVSADDLQQFDVLYLHASATGYSPAFLPSDNEKLRRFVDGGGQLIVEYGGPVPTTVSPLFTDTNWASASDFPVTLVSVAGSLLTQHPIVSQPYPLWQVDPHFPFFLGMANDINNNIYGTITSGGTGEYTNLFGAALYRTASTGTMPAVPTLPAVSAAQLGAGQVVVSALDIGPHTTLAYGATFGTPAAPINLSLASTGDLKFLSNIVSWADTHPTENKTSHQNAAGPSAASFAAAWSYPDPAQGQPLRGTTSTTPPPPGATVWGNFVFVTDSTGILRAFDAYPDQDLTGKGSPDLGTAAPPTPYGEIWEKASLGTPASAPTVANYGGQTLVMVEDKTGVVYAYVAATGVPFTTPKLGTANANGSFAASVPAPTYYDGRVYAGQPDGTLLVYDLNPNASAGGGITIPVNPTTTTGEYVTASPAVGLLASGLETNTVTALVPTTQNMNTVLLGARNDPLTAYSTNGQFTGYNVNRNGRYGLFNLFVDPSSVPAGRAYDANGNNVVPVSGGQDPVFGSTNLNQDQEGFFGSWDIDFRASTGQINNAPPNGSTLTLHEIKALSVANTGGGSAAISAPAIDRHGDYYYTVFDPSNNFSYLFGVHDDIQQRNVRVKFRFRLPKANDPSAVDASGTAWTNMDADHVNYNNTMTNPADGSSRSLMDFRFVGTPVVDGQGNVYVAAQKSSGGNVAAVLCFNADREPTAEPDPTQGPISTAFNAMTATYYQNDEFDQSQQNIPALPSTRRGAGRAGQMSTASNQGTGANPLINQASVFNFARGSGGARQIAGDLSEPQPFTGMMNVNGGPSILATMYFHTNLAWYATFAVNGQISGLSKAGSVLMLCDSGPGGSGSYNTLYKLPAAPTVGAGKLAALTVQRSPLGTGIDQTGKPNLLNIGQVAAAPSAGGGAMVVNGGQGIAAFNQQLTLIADNNRILEVDADGNAVWSADATTRPGGNGVSTKVDFAHPSALAQFAANDYLVADTGNNRCVRFDRAGNVVWELTRFYDPSGLMAPGQPLTLSQPTSIEVRREVFNYKDPVNGAALTGQMVHYLVADSGNDRIVEVTDTLDAAGNILYFDRNTPANVVQPPPLGPSNSVTHDHLLTWVTHTGDKYGRRYHYAGASYLDIPSATVGAADTVRVVALVTNTRIAQPTATGLAAASGDAPGGSIVSFLLPIPQRAFSDPTLKNDLVYVATSFNMTTATGTTQNLPVRNPRFLHVYAPPQPTPATPDLYAYSFLYADDNGAFDLVYQPPGANGQTTPPVSYGLAFTQASYRSMTIPADVQGNVPLRGGLTTSTPPIPPLPFVPTCVQRLNDDATNVAGTSHIERYLITQSFSQSELGRQPGTPLPYRLGGEIFEVDVSTIANGGTTVTMYPVGGFGGGLTVTGSGTPPGPLVGFTLSRPVGTSPLTQPTFAIRTPQ